MLWSLLPSTLFPHMFRFLVKAITDIFYFEMRQHCVKKFLAPCISKLTVLSINLILTSMISRPYSALSAVGNVWSVNDWSQSLSESAGSNIPSLGRGRSVNAPPQDEQNNQIPTPCPAPPPPSPPGCINTLAFRYLSQNSSARVLYNVHLALGY